MTIKTLDVGGRLLLAGTLVAAAITLTSTASFAQRGLREKQVVVSAVDKDGKAVSGLAATDVVIREDDVAREVLNVEPASRPMQVALLFDTSAASQNLIPDLRKGLASFTSALLAKSPDSEISLMSFGERPTKEAGPTGDVATLQRTILRVFPRPGAGSYLLEAISDAAKDLKKRSATRPVIVAFVNTDGPEFSSETHQQIADVLKDAGVELWAIVLQTRPAAPTSDEARNRETVLGDVTTRSGGTRDSLMARSAIDGAFVAVADRLTSQYVITYSRPDALIPPNRLEVSVKREGVRLLAPRWSSQ